MENKIEIFKTTDNQTEIKVQFDEDTVWLNRLQLSELFGRDIKTIGKHINNVFTEGELDKNVVDAKFATTTQHGALERRTQTKDVDCGSLLSFFYAKKQCSVQFTGKTNNK